MNVLVTGATGFLGRHLCEALKGELNINLTACIRKYHNIDYNSVVVPSIDANTNWRDVLEVQDVVIHTAASMHKIKRNARQREDCGKIDIDGTLNIARQAALFGVKRLIFISSIKVNGEQTLSKVMLLCLNYNY